MAIGPGDHAGGTQRAILDREVTPLLAEVHGGLAGGRAVEASEEGRADVRVAYGVVVEEELAASVEAQGQAATKALEGSFIEGHGASIRGLRPGARALGCVAAGVRVTSRA